MSNKQTTVSKDPANKKIVVMREFDAPLEEVWKAWTDSSILDTWWAPKPWRAKTKSMDFREGGCWLYSMVGPDGSESYCRVDYQSIVENKSFISDDSFCDENGNITHEMPGMHWKNEFSGTGSGTRVSCELTFDTDADVKTIIEMGFEEGFTSAHGNLDEILKK